MVAGGGERGDVYVVGDTVAVVVVVPEVGDAVVVGVAAHGRAVWCRPFQAIGDAVFVTVGISGVAVPRLPRVGVPLDFERVGDAVSVAIEVVGVGAEAIFGEIIEAVVVGVGAGTAVAADDGGIGGAG